MVLWCTVICFETCLSFAGSRHWTWNLSTSVAMTVNMVASPPPTPPPAIPRPLRAHMGNCTRARANTNKEWDKILHGEQQQQKWRKKEEEKKSSFGKAEVSDVEVLAASKARKAIAWPTPGLVQKEARIATSDLIQREARIATVWPTPGLIQREIQTAKGWPTQT